MVKAEKQTNTAFTPIVLTIETEEELDFLYNLFVSYKGVIKEDVTGFTDELDEKFYNALAGVRN